MSASLPWMGDVTQGCGLNDGAPTWPAPVCEAVPAPLRAWSQHQSKGLLGVASSDEVRTGFWLGSKTFEAEGKTATARLVLRDDFGDDELTYGYVKEGPRWYVQPRDVEY